MSRKLFRKALNHIESRSCDSNISRLNDELKKTGMLSERMTTSTVLPPTETQPFIPPTSSPAPLGDLSDLNTFAWDNAAQGNGSSISHDFSQLATTDVNGETKSILEIPSISTTDGTGFTGTVYGLAFGPNTAVSGNPLGYINENGFNHVYQYQNVFSVTHTEFSRALVDYYEDNAFTSKVIYLWGPLLYRVTQPIQPAAFYPSGSDFNSQPRAERGLYGYTLLIPVDSNGNIKRNNIITDLGQSRTIVLNRLDDPSAPDYHEGDFTRYLKNLLDLSGQAFDYLDQKALETEKLIAGYGLRPDGTQGLNHPGDVNRGHDGTLYKLVPRPGYGYNMWVPLKKASAGEDEIALDTVPYEPPSPGPGGYKRPGSYDPSKFFDIPTNHGPQFPSPNLPQTGPGRSSVPGKDNKKKQSVVAHHELEGEVLSEGWQSPDHTNVEKDSKTRWFNPNAGTDSAKWFDPKEVKPAYPAKAPPKMIDGYSADSNLAPKPVEKSPAIKLTKKDLLRNHKLKDSEVAGMMQTIARLNKFIADHPEELIYAKSRYPKHDPRLAELNWNMDQMLKASGDYLDKQFPENERLFARIQNSIVKNIKATDPEEYKEVITSIEAEKKARKIKKSHLSRKVSERERKSAFSRALKHLPTEARVQSDVTKERIEEIAKAELEYLKTIGKPKYYDWKDDGFDFLENFEDRKKSIQHFHSLIDKRIENLENALEEGMTTSEYLKQLYGEIPTITSIMSIDPNLLGSKFAQDVVQDSEKATTHAYGSHFPGSYVNSIGDFNPQSYSKVDVQAHITTDHEVTPNEGEMAHPEDHVFTYQSEGNSIKWPTEYTFPDSFSDDLAYFDAEGNPQEWIHYIWPVHGHPGNYTPLDSANDDTPFWLRSQSATSWGSGNSDSRLQYNDGRIDRRSITDTSFDVTYGAARSIDSSAFDLTGNMDSTPWGEGFEDEYNLDVNDIAAVNALRTQWDRPTSETGLEEWQYIRSATGTGYIDQIYGIDFPFTEYYYYDSEDDHDEFTGTDGWRRFHPNLNTDASFAKKIIKNVQVGDKISFSYKWYSDTWLYEGEYYIGNSDYIHDGIQYADDEPRQSYFRAIIGANNKVVSIKDQWQLMGADPNLTLTDGTYTIPPIDDDLLNAEYIAKKDNGFTYPYNGTYEYTVQEGDIDAAGLFQFTTILLTESTNLEYVQVTDFAHTVGDKANAGQLGKTTAAYNLGTSVAALDPNNKKKKKKKDEQDQETDSAETDSAETEDAFTKGGKTYDKETYSVLGPYTPSVDKVKNYPTYSDIKGQTEPPEPGSQYYTTYYRFHVPKQGSEYEAWLSSIPAEQAVKIRDTKQKEDPVANQKYVGKFQMFGKPKLYGKYGDKSYYNPADTGQKVPNQVKITWDPYGAPNRQDRFGQRLANPGEKQDSYGFPLGRDEEESDYTYWRGKRYLKGSYDDTAEIDPKTGKFRGNFSWFAEKDPASAKTGNSDTMSTTTNWKGPRAAWAHREFVGLGPNEEIEQVIQYRKHRDLMRKKYGRLREIPKQYHKNNNYLESLNRLVVATMPKGWARPFVPVDGKGPEDKLTKNDDPYQLKLGYATKKFNSKFNKLVNKFGNQIGNELAKIYQRLSTFRYAGTTFANFLLQQQGMKNYTKKKPYNVKLPKEDAQAIANTLNELFRTKIPRERWNNLNQKDMALINKTLNPTSGPTPTNRHRKGSSPNEDEYHNTFNNLGNPKGIKVKVTKDGEPYVSELNDNFVFENDADASVMGAPALIKFFSTAGGAQDREDAAGGGEYTYKAGGVFSGNVDDIKPPTDLKMKNMPIRLKLPPPSNVSINEELYPGQPSPNGFPDTPPPKLAPNGYHPKYGKKADRYRKLDPVSAVMMRKVGTDDPQINKQVSDAAKKPK